MWSRRKHGEKKKTWATLTHIYSNEYKLCGLFPVKAFWCFSHSICHRFWLAITVVVRNELTLSGSLVRTRKSHFVLKQYEPPPPSQPPSYVSWNVDRKSTCTKVSTLFSLHILRFQFIHIHSFVCVTVFGTFVTNPNYVDTIFFLFVSLLSMIYTLC